MMLVVSSCIAQGFESSLISQTGYFNVVPDVNDILKAEKSRAYYESSQLDHVRIMLTETSHSTPLLGRLDFYNSALQVEMAGDYFVVELENFRELEFYNTSGLNEVDTVTFVNSKKVLGTKKSMLLEVLVYGSAPLLKHRKVKFQKANYNKALDIGSKEDEYFATTVLFTMNNGKLIELPLTKEAKLKRRLAQVFGDEVAQLSFFENEGALVNYFKLKNVKND